MATIDLEYRTGANSVASRRSGPLVQLARWVRHLIVGSAGQTTVSMPSYETALHYTRTKGLKQADHLRSAAALFELGSGRAEKR